MSEQFCLRWNNHQSTLISVFENLLESGSLIDCTLCAEGQLLKAHKVVLSACSPTFESMLCIQEDKHPIIFLKDVRFIELKAMIDYMYKGEVNILQDQLDSFLKTAAALQIKGLTDQGGGGGDEPPAKKGPGRKTGMSDVAPESPLVGNAPLREGSMSPTRRRRRLPRRPSSAEDASADNSSCDIPPPATAPNVLPASTPNPLPASDSSPAPRLSVKKTEPLDPLITPKQEMLDEPAEDIEDLTLDDDDDYNDAMSDMSKPGTSFGAMAPGNTSQDFSQWQQMMGAADRSGQDEVFMAAQEAINNQSNTQGKALFYEVMKPIFESKRQQKNSSYINREVYDCYINEVKEAQTTPKKSSLHYRRLRRFDIVVDAGVERLICASGPNSQEVKYFVTYEEFYDIIAEAHALTGHGGRHKVIQEISKTYKNVTKEAVLTYLRLCPDCGRKRKRKRPREKSESDMDMDMECE